MAAPSEEKKFVLVVSDDSGQEFEVDLTHAAEVTLDPNTAKLQVIGLAAEAWRAKQYWEEDSSGGTRLDLNELQHQVSDFQAKGILPQTVDGDKVISLLESAEEDGWEVAVLLLNKSMSV